MITFNKSLKLSGLALVAAVLSTGCLKDDPAVDIDTGARYLELMGPTSGTYGQVLNYITYDTTVPLLTINLAADQPAPEDITVTVAVDPAVIAAYNARQSSSFVPFTSLPEANFSIPSLTATIPKGQREAVIEAVIKNATFLESGKYAIGMKIVSSSNPSIIISQNWGKQVVAMRVKNKYHGLYHAAGTFTHPTAGVRDIDEDKELVTVEPNSVEAPLGDLGAAGYSMILTINADNTVTVEPSGVTPDINQSWGPNFYDPADQSFHLHYSYNGSGGPRIIKEVITRQ